MKDPKTYIHDSMAMNVSVFDTTGIEIGPVHTLAAEHGGDCYTRDITIHAADRRFIITVFADDISSTQINPEP